jgi:hypothetical protein
MTAQYEPIFQNVPTKMWIFSVKTIQFSIRFVSILDKIFRLPLVECNSKLPKQSFTAKILIRNTSIS